ncbi:MAG: hypothetical protein ACLR4Z_14900 [Butyricicoccaceae bacterium]
MAKTQYTKAALKEAIAGKLQRHFACEVKDATKDQIYEACALVIRDALTENMIETQNEVERDGDRQVHYLCMEFLVRPQPAQQCLQPRHARRADRSAQRHGF